MTSKMAMSPAMKAIINMLDVIGESTFDHVHIEMYVSKPIYLQLEQDCQNYRVARGAEPVDFGKVSGQREVRYNSYSGDVIIRNIDDGYAHVVVTKA